MHGSETARTRAELASVRPELIAGYDAALPRARAEILSRLLGAIHREPLPRARDLVYPGEAAQPFVVPEPGLTVHLGGTAISDPQHLITALGWPSGFGTEIGNSVANLALAYADPAPRSPRPLLATGPGLATLEQQVADGHPLHPGCRTRTGLSTADVLRYAPEHRPTLRLHRIAVPADRWYGTAPPILLAHPWQAEHLRDTYPWLQPAGLSEPVRPLMSLRTVDAGAVHVKTAVDVQMTSAVRTVSPAAVHNGPLLSALLTELTADLPLEVLRESGAGAVLVDGQPSRHLAHLRRQAPRVQAGEVVLPLAALAAPDPYDGEPLVVRAALNPYQWWHDLMFLIFPVVISVLERGVALEAHGQNLLVVLRDGRPVRLVYRDFGGVRVARSVLDISLSTDDPAVLRTKLSAAVLGTVTGQLIAVLQRAGADAGKLWTITAQAIAAVGTGHATAMLREPIPVKATTAMRLAADPLDDVWAYLDNPMAAS
ncbi:IucA/IucC family protein [Actinoplanes sp. TFC3]|uniref:IucA/IucC family protein n=1 Tax=Actinoplanes sp. TFC3 TaxID=1710355 RepID=UPI00351561E5